MSDQVVTIYALVDPRTTEVRYVGQSRNLRRRFQKHLRAETATHRDKWIRSLREKGDFPVLVVLEVVTVEDWVSRERYWIAYYRTSGADLTNHTDGGEGAPNLSPDRLAARARKISAALTGKKWSPEHRARFSEVRKGVKSTPEAIAKRTAGINKTFADPERVKFRNAAIKRAYDEKPERREAKRAAFLATWAKEGAHEAASEERKRRWADPEYKARVTASLIAAGSRPEVKEKVGKATREHWQDEEFRARETEKRRQQGADPDFRAKMTEITNAPEHRARNSANLKALWQDPAYVAKQMAARAAARERKRQTSE